MDLQIKGRVAIVTGASKGIGRAIAKHMAKEGVKVVACARGAKALTELQRDIEKSGGTALAVAGDVTREKDIQRIVAEAVKAFGGIDIVVNNVGGVSQFAQFMEVTDESWMKTYELNIMSIVYMVRAALPFLRKSAAPRIINIASISGVQPGSYNPHYSVVKAGQMSLTKYLSNYLAGDRILVNAVCPGPVHSDAWDVNSVELARQKNMDLDKFREEMEARERAGIPLGRVGEGEDVTGLVLLLASAHGSWITGSCFHVNGGKLRSIY